MAALLVLSAVGHVAWMIALSWALDRVTAARLENDRLRSLLDESREFSRDCLAQSNRMAHVAIAPRIKGA